MRGGHQIPMSDVLRVDVSNTLIWRCCSHRAALPCVLPPAERLVANVSGPHLLHSASWLWESRVCRLVNIAHGSTRRVVEKQGCESIAALAQAGCMSSTQCTA